MIQKHKENDETLSISTAALFVVLKKEYKIILLVILFFLIIGISYILIIPKEYISTGKIMPEVSYKASNGMGGLNELLKKYNGNIDVYNTEITSPELYAEIINTSEFCDYILAKEINTKRNEKISFKAYYDLKLKSKTSFFNREKSNFEANDKMTHYNIAKDIQTRIAVTIAKRNNLISVSVKMEDPVVAADIANFTIIYLIDYITKYRTEKTRQELRFIESLQKDVSNDSSKNIQLKTEIQSSLSASVIQMKIKIQEDTPTIQVLEKPQIPVFSSEPPTLRVFAEFIFLGLLTGVIIVLLKNYNYKTILNSSSPTYKE
ncbi:Wzz/FepE/Etk N-terminal domain-containing protein [Flavobacterium sp. UBA4854]|uniref:Wzz/FepE/Etk N-terminal domain-containing protein n=1 Tax=Flavobacterium sp. UBA4854 TaxID=1946548 RepID=UPI00257BC401|nr:Wzz/FepE/Etk N-terminal domain-containing protein [Flavobacterium sp. UBA4854]